VRDIPRRRRQAPPRRRSEVVLVTLPVSALRQPVKACSGAVGAGFGVYDDFVDDPRFRGDGRRLPPSSAEMKGQSGAHVDGIRTCPLLLGEQVTDGWTTPRRGRRCAVRPRHLRDTNPVVYSACRTRRCRRFSPLSTIRVRTQRHGEPRCDTRGWMGRP